MPDVGKHPQPVRHKDEALVSLQGLVDSNMSLSPHPLFCQRRYLQGMLSEQQRMIPPLAGKKRNPCSHRSDRARAQGRVATPFPVVVGVAHCVTELAHEDPYTDAATTISARGGIIQLVLRLVTCATRCHRRAARATGVRTRAGCTQQANLASVSLRVQVDPHMGHSTMQLRA